MIPQDRLSVPSTHIHDNKKMAAVLFTTILCERKHPQLGVIPSKTILKDKLVGVLSTTLWLKRAFSIIILGIMNIIILVLTPYPISRLSRISNWYSVKRGRLIGHSQLNHPHCQVGQKGRAGRSSIQHLTYLDLKNLLLHVRWGGGIRLCWTTEH